ncbi:MAG: hypothetical protein Kow00121_54190 [Elainellaceae cyanobacterium]
MNYTLLTSGTIQAAKSVQNPVPTAYPVRLWQYGSAPSDTQYANTIVLIHGRQTQDPDRTLGIEKLFPQFNAFAESLVNDSTQVLFLDWGEAAVGGALPPYSAAGRVQAVAEWAVQALQLQGRSQPITLVGHSLGSYLAAEVSRSLGNQARLVALDPAFPGNNYDLDTLQPQKQQVSAFDAAAAQSVAFVVADDLLQTGIAGDNDQAGTANASFIVRFKSLAGVFDATEAHNAVIDLYQDWTTFVAPGSELEHKLLSRFSKNRYDNFGNRRAGKHEGIVRVAQDAGQWQITQIDGEETDIYLVRDAEAVPIDRDGGRDTILSTVSVTLNDSLEDLVLGGSVATNGTGNARANWIDGNAANNQLTGDRGNDQLLGNAGADTLVEGDGADTLWGGKGRDLLIGGADADSFVLETGPGQMLVQDFTNGEDKLGLTAGLEFAALTVSDRQGNTTLQVGEDLLATLIGIESRLISAADFRAIG